MRRLDYFLAGLGGALMVALFYLLSPAVLEAVQYPAVRLTDNSGNYVGSVSNPIAVSGGGVSPTSPVQVQSLGVNTPAPATAGDIDSFDARGGTPNTMHTCVLASAFSNGAMIGFNTSCASVSESNAALFGTSATTTVDAGSRINLAIGNTVYGSLDTTDFTIGGGVALQSTGGTVPTITCSGGSTGTSVTAGSTNNRGSFVSSSTASTTCTLTFSASGVWNQAPFCNFYDAGGSITPTAYSAPARCASTSACIVSFASATSKTIGYICM